MAHRALTFGNGGYADLAVTFGEFVQADHTLTLRFMPQYPYGQSGPMLSDTGVSNIYSFGQGDYRSGNGSDGVLGQSVLSVRIGSSSVVYLVTGFTDQVGGPVGYRDVWQHLAVVREGNGFRTYLNGHRLTAFSGTETFPSDLPSDTTPLRLGRRGYDQFYGLIGEVAIYTRALSATELTTAAGQWLTGDEQGLLAGFTFSSSSMPAPLNRTVTLPIAADIPDYVTANADQPVPAYYVDVSPNHDSAADRKRYDLRPSKVGATLPFCAGEWWHVVQGHDDPTSSHNGYATFSFDFTRLNGETPHATIIAAAPGRLYYADDQEDDDGGNAISVYHAANERAVYMHLQKNSVRNNFPTLHDNPENLPISQQPTFAARDRLTNVGDPLSVGPHLHFAISTQHGDTFADNGVGQPVGILGYYQSKDNGETWKQVPLGVPAKGDMISRYPWSPFGEDGDPLDIAPAVSSRGPNRLDVFACGQNGHLWIVKWNGQTWSKWEDLGSGRLTSSPAAVSWDEHRIDVFVRGHDDQLAHKHWTSTGGWSGWDSLGGRLTSAPAVASWGPNRLDVFMRGHQGQLVHKRWSQPAGWGPWDDLGGRLTSAPAAVSWGENRIDVFVRGHEGQLAHKRWSAHAGWGNWDDLGGRLTSAPAVASWGRQRLDVFMRGHDGQLVHKRWSEHAGWGGWDDLGGRLTSGPAAVSWAEERIDIFVRGHDHGLASMSWTPGTSWTSWKNLDK
jgi:concanavalin A-like lectin/glucanase superfamily protein